MMKKPIKKTCSICGREHYSNRSCVKKREEPEHNLYSRVKPKKFIG